MINTPAFGGIGRALSNPQFKLFWASNGLSTIGRWVYRTAAAWLTWELTKSTVWLGVIAFADVFPMVVLSVFAGAMSDRIGYLRVMKAMQLALTVVAVAFSILIFAGLMKIELVLVLAICHGISEAMATPPRISIVNALVRKEDLSAAVALNSATFNACRIIGPAITGALLLVVEADLVFAVATATLAQHYVVLFFLRAPGAGGTGTVSMALVRDAWDGMVYAWRHPGIRFLMVCLGTRWR